MGSLDKAAELLQSMPADLSLDEHYVEKHNKALKKLAQQRLTIIMVDAQKMSFVMAALGEHEKPAVQEYMKSACQEHVNKVLQILGMLVEDPYQQELIEMVQGWKPGDILDLALFTKTHPASSDSEATASSVTSGKVCIMGSFSSNAYAAAKWGKMSFKLPHLVKNRAPKNLRPIGLI